MNAVGILGGTFDPVHLGHLITAQSLIELRNLQKIIFIPAFISPHKTGIKSSSPEDRLNMIKLAIEGKPCFDYSDYEISKGGISFTLDTLKEMKKEYSNLELIIGHDNLEKFYSWKEPDEIIKTAKLIVMQREIDKPADIKDRYFNSAIFVKTPVIQISATEIRERINNNKSIDYLVPEKVKEYILNRKLYK